MVTFAQPEVHDCIQDAPLSPAERRRLTTIVAYFPKARSARVLDFQNESSFANVFSTAIARSGSRGFTPLPEKAIEAFDSCLRAMWIKKKEQSKLVVSGVLGHGFLTPLDPMERTSFAKLAVPMIDDRPVLPTYTIMNEKGALHYDESLKNKKP